MPKAPTDPRLDILEKDLQKQIRKFAQDMGWLCTVTWSSLNSPKGWPDIFAVRRGEAVAIECKREPKHCRNDEPKGIVDGVTPEQRRWLAELAALPGVKFAGVVRPSDWHNGVLDGVLR